MRLQPVARTGRAQKIIDASTIALQRRTVRDVLPSCSRSMKIHSFLTTENNLKRRDIMEGTKSYRFKVYAGGRLIQETQAMDQAQAKEFYKVAFNPDEVALRLLVDDAPVIYGKTADVLGLSRGERFGMGMQWLSKGYSSSAIRRA